VVKALIAIVFATVALAACASPRASSEAVSAAASDAFSRAGASIDQTLSALETPEDSVVADPFEPFNRAMFAFNNGVDRVLLEPTAKAYEAVVPQFGRARVRDFIDNWKTPVWLANDVLQGDFDHAGVTSSRFALNTTVGVLGFYDFAAAHADLPKRDEDFGQTLGKWGMGNGAYLMLPILGPTTFRDFSGNIVDVAIDPFTWGEFNGDSAYRGGTRVLDVVDIRVQTAPAIDAVNESVDPYAQARALYIQSRAERVRNGVESYEDLPEFE
jgi:phospholipid-binding lipoprotein MlaA